MKMGFTQLEKDTLKQLAMGSSELELSRQLESCTFVDREITAVGFFTGLGVPEGVEVLTATGHLLGPKLCAPELEIGAFIILHCSEEKIDYLEVYSNANEPIFLPDGTLAISRWWFEEEKVNIIDLRS